MQKFLSNQGKNIEKTFEIDNKIDLIAGSSIFIRR